MASALRAGDTPLPSSPTNAGRKAVRYASRSGYVAAAMSGGGAPVAVPSVLVDAGGIAIDPLNPAFMVPLV